MEKDLNLPLGSLEVIICGESSSKFTMYRKQRLMVLLQERNQNANNKNVENCIETQHVRNLDP